MKISVSVLALVATLTSAGPSGKRSTTTPLTIDLTANDNSKVKAAITNNAQQGFNLFHKGSFLDTQPVDRLTVTKAGTRVGFNGVLLTLARTGLTQDSFFSLRAGETKEVEFDIAEVYDVGTTSVYDLVAEGAFPYAELNSTTLTGKAIPFSSNKLSIDVDGDLATQVQHAYNKRMALKRRTIIQSDCTSTQRSALVSAASGCQSLASRAASDAASGSSAQFRRYFAASSASTVAARLRAVASECSSTSSGGTRSYCTDILGACEAGVIAYTQPASNVLAYCPIYYSQLTANPQTCDGLTRDRAATTLHEMTHARAVYSPNTVDYAYGTAASVQLTAAQKLLNADSYALYAADLALGCSTAAAADDAENLSAYRRYLNQIRAKFGW